MAKAKQQEGNFRKKKRVKRPGIHSKKKNSVHKKGKHYKKAYKGTRSKKKTITLHITELICL